MCGCAIAFQDRPILALFAVVGAAGTGFLKPRFAVRQPGAPAT
jgi:hypothetical protein